MFYFKINFSLTEQNRDFLEIVDILAQLSVRLKCHGCTKNVNVLLQNRLERMKDV